MYNFAEQSIFQDIEKNSGLNFKITPCSISNFTETDINFIDIPANSAIYILKAYSKEAAQALIESLDNFIKLSANSAFSGLKEFYTPITLTNIEYIEFIFVQFTEK